MAKCITLPPISAKLSAKDTSVASDFSFKIYNEINAIPALAIEELGCSQSFFFSPAYWKSYEHAFSNKITFRYIVLCYLGEAVAFAPFQIIKFDGSNVANANTDDSLLQKVKTRLVKNIVNLVSIRLLVSGNTFLTGELSLFVKKGFLLNEKLATAYNASIENLMEQEQLNGILIKDFYVETAGKLNVLEQNGFLRFQVNPNMEMNIEPSWNTISDYEQDLSSKYRVRYHKALQRSEGLIFRELSVADTVANEVALNNMLQEVLQNSDFKLFNPDVAYMKSLQLHFPETFRLMGIFKNNSLIGFYSTYLDNKQLVACFVGMNKAFLKEHDLYLNILYKLIEQAITLKTTTLIFGRTAMEIKSSVGALPKDMFLFVKHACPVRNYLVHKAVKTLSKNPEWTLREPFKRKSPAK